MHLSGDCLRIAFHLHSGLWAVLESGLKILVIYWPVFTVYNRPPGAPFYPNMTVLSQVLVLLSDKANDGRTLISVPKHSQTSQDVAKTPPRCPRGPQDRPKTPKMTPKAHPR